MNLNCGNEPKECDLMLSLFNSMDLCSVFIEKSGVILYHSKEFEDTFQIENEKLVGKRLSDVVCQKVYEELRKLILEVLFTNKSVKNELSFDDKWYIFMIYPVISNQEVTHLLINGADISKRKRLEQENEELKKKVEESNSIKSIFLSNMSHELRTPMNAIIGFSDILLQNSNGKDQKERFLKSINSNAKHLDELLNNILDYAKIETDEFDLLYENFSLNDLMEELFDIFDDVNYKKNLNFVKLEFIKGEDKKIISDYLRLKQVLFNIISNSIKFTDKGYIKISFEEFDDCIIFKIEDTGIGIPKDKIKFIFDRFWQCDSSSRKKYKGTGLGLSISKSIVELFNGKIWAESELGKGTSFYIKIPLEEMKQDLIIIKNKDKIDFSNKTVLVVDEIPINYSLISMYLSSLNVNMIMTYSGKDAIKTFKKQKEKIDLIIIDLNIHDMNGLEVIEKLRIIDNNCKIISKSGVEYENQNVNLHLKKPFRKDKLISFLNQIWQK